MAANKTFFIGIPVVPKLGEQSLQDDVDGLTGLIGAVLNQQPAETDTDAMKVIEGTGLDEVRVYKITIEATEA